MRPLSILAVLAVLATVSQPAHAQLDPESSEENEDGQEQEDSTDEEEEVEVEVGENASEADEEEEDEAAARKRRLDPHEKKGLQYLFLGLTMRGVIAPEFLLEAFLAAAPRVADWSTGLELTIRKDGYDIIPAVWWAGYRFQGPIRDKNDPELDTEWVDSNWSMLLTTVSFLWNKEFTDQLALQYGFDVGAGFVLGDMRRSEAKPRAEGGYEPCLSSADPSPYCETPSNPVPGSDPQTDADDAKGAHYNVKQRRWAQGGNGPNLVPWLALRLALRYKPIKQVMTRAELGFGLGFYLGLSAAYGF